MNQYAKYELAVLIVEILNNLTRYTDSSGNISNSKDATFKYDPYVKGDALPANPYNNKSDVTIDSAETDITVKASGGVDTDYKFYSTGVQWLLTAPTRRSRYRIFNDRDS